MATFANISHLAPEVLAVVALAAVGVMGGACVVLWLFSRRKTAMKPPPIPNELKRPVDSANTSASVVHGKNQT
jgi:hypothetical protein